MLRLFHRGNRDGALIKTELLFPSDDAEEKRLEQRRSGEARPPLGSPAVLQTTPRGDLLSAERTSERSVPASRPSTGVQADSSSVRSGDGGVS